MGASRVCITWFLASHNKTLWNAIKLNDLDSIFLDNSYVPGIQDNDRVKRRYHLRKILIEINKFSRTVPINFFFNLYCNIVEEDLAILSKGMPNMIKLGLPMWTSLNLNSIQSAFSKWKNLQTLILGPFISSGDVLSLELRAIGDNCRNLTNMKFYSVLKEDLANKIVCNFPSLERLSFRCSYVCTEASIALIFGLPNLKVLNLSHCIFMEPSGIGDSYYMLGMKPKEELVQTGNQKLDKFMVCCSDCTICQDIWKYTNDRTCKELNSRYVGEERWKTDEIKELVF